MIIAGEPSGDTLGAELVRALRVELPRREGESPDPHAQPLRSTLEPRFFGAGGKAMVEAGVEVGLDLTRHAVVGLVEVLKNYGQFKRMFDQLLRWAIERQPWLWGLANQAG